MSIEYNPHSFAADFWRQAYLKAMEVGHKDPTAVADAAFVDFESRFGVQVEVEQECLCGGGVSLQSVSGGAHPTGLHGTAWLNVEGTWAEELAERADTETLALVPKADDPNRNVQFHALLDAAAGAPIGEGPSIEVGDAPQVLEHGWQAGHVVPAEDTGDLG